MGKRSKPLRPGDDCPECSKLLFPHCPEKQWPAGCPWVKCRACGGYGVVDRFVTGTPDAQLDDD